MAKTFKDEYKLLKSLRSHGVVKDPRMQKIHGPWYYEMREFGNNYRLSDIHAALGISQLKRLNSFIKKRKFIARFYNKLFCDKSKFTTPLVRKNCSHSYHLYRYRSTKKTQKALKTSKNNKNYK